MVGPWPHRPGTLRALLTTLKGACFVIYRAGERYAPLSAEREDIDRPYEPCPFVCSQCGARAEIAMAAPSGSTLTTPAPRERKRLAIRTDPRAKLGPWHTRTFQKTYSTASTRLQAGHMSNQSARKCRLI